MMLEDPGTIVLLPPMGGDERCWDFIDFQAIGIPESSLHRYIYPGHGSAPRHPGLSFPFMADEVAGLVDGEFHVIAVAAGVAIASQFIVRHPGRIRSAMFVCAGFSPALHGEELANTVERAERPVREGMQSVLPEMATRWFTPWARANGNPGLAYSQECLAAMDPEGWRDIWLAVSQRENVPEPVIRGMDFPVSLVASLQDPTGGVKNTQTLHSQLPLSRLEYIPGPHMVHLERPSEVQAAIERHFLWIGADPQRVEQPMHFTTD